jgi:hypothetical protein
VTLDIQKGEAVAGGPLTLPEDYGFDVKGYIHLRGLLSPAELARLADPGGHEALRSHTGLGRYLDLLMGEGNSRMPETGAPCRLPQGPIEALQIPTSAAVERRPLLFGGGEMRRPDRGYVNHEGHRFAQGVRVIVARTAAPADCGGFVVVPCSHKLRIDAPQDLVEGTDDMARLGHSIVVQPALQPGDALLCVSTLMYGVRHWSGDGPPPALLHCEYIGQVAAPGTFAKEEVWMGELSPEQRVVMGLKAPGYDVPAALVSDGRSVSIGSAAIDYHPRRLQVVDDEAIDADEQVSGWLARMVLCIADTVHEWTQID